MRRRTKKPAPFQRPSIELGKHGREWMQVPAHSLTNGDIVRDHGLVEEVPEISSILGVHVVFLNRESFWFEIDEKVTAFVRKENHV